MPEALGASFSLSEEDEVESESDAAAKNLDMLIGVDGHSAISDGFGIKPGAEMVVK